MIPLIGDETCPLGRFRDEGGQVIVLVALFTVVLMGFAGLVVDVGSWYLQSREVQVTADAAALAAAQALPGDPSTAQSLALQYASENGGGLSLTGVAFSDEFQPDDTVSVAVSRNAPAFFSKLFSINSVTVRATAAARADVPSEALLVAPITVSITQPALSGAACGQNTGANPSPCFGDVTTIPLGKNGIPGSFGLIDLDQTSNGTAGASTLANWIADGYGSYLPLGAYTSDTGAKFRDAPIQAALQGRLGSILLFPVFDSETGQGQNAVYNIVAWAAFDVQSFSSSGHSGSVTGYFTRVTWAGIQSGTNPNIPDLGVTTVSLVQ